MKKRYITYIGLGILFGVILGLVGGIASAEKMTIISTSDDGYIEKNDVGNGYAWCNAQPNGDFVFGGNTIRIGQTYLPIPKTYIIDRGVLFFDKKEIDFDNWDILHARINVFLASDMSTVNFNMIVQKHYPYNTPLLRQDYNRSNFTGNYGQFVNTLYYPAVNYWLHCDIDNNNIDNFTNDILNVTGDYASIGLRSDMDIGINAPSTNEYIDVYANEYGAVRPTLEIWYKNKTDYDQTITQWFNTTVGNTSSNCSITATYWGANETINLTGIHTLLFPSNFLQQYWFNVTSSPHTANCSVNVSYNYTSDVFNITGVNTIYGTCSSGGVCNCSNFTGNSWYNITNENGTSSCYVNWSYSNVTCNLTINGTNYHEVNDSNWLYYSGLDVEPELLFLSLWFFIFFVWWKSESEDMTDYMAILFLPYTVFLCVIILPSYIAEIESEWRWLTYFIFIAIAIIVTVYSYDVWRKRKK